MTATQKNEATRKRLKATLKLFYSTLEKDFVNDGWDKQDAYCVIEEAIMATTNEILEEIADEQN
jgi:hypothetical protein